MSAIVVTPYNPEWPAAFEEWKELVLKVIGDVVLQVDHVGSTSVPGLAAKPKIDIDAVLNSSSDIPEAVERVKTLSGFLYHGDPYEDGMWTFSTRSGDHRFGIRLYLCAPHTEHHIKRILFRDWLRHTPEDLERYAALKRRLATEADGDWKFYTAGKSDFVNAIVQKAATAAGVSLQKVPITL